jgi:hypothetical protein
VSGQRLRDDEVDRLLREAFPDDLPEGLEAALRAHARRAWRRAASAPPRSRWWARLPQPALAAAALALLALGTVMQAAPAPRVVVEALVGRQASAAVARALADARQMRCTVEVADGRGRVLAYGIEWTSPGSVRVRLSRAGAVEERTLRAPGPAPSVLTSTHETPDAVRDPDLEPVRSCLSPSALRERLAAAWRPAPGNQDEVFVVGSGPRTPGLTVRIDTATHLPLRLDGTDPDGRKKAAVCRWP